MADNGDPNLTVTQVGLFTADAQEAAAFAKRVYKFNQKYASNIIVDLEPHDKGDSQCDRPQVKIRLKFPNHQVQDAFWSE